MRSERPSALRSPTSQTVAPSPLAPPVCSNDPSDSLGASTVFVGAGARLPSAVFATRQLAEAWIALHQVTGLLTAYPMGQGVYDWAIQTGALSSLDLNPSRHQLLAHHDQDPRCRGARTAVFRAFRL